MTLQERLFELQDEAYGDFHSSLIPGFPREFFIGIRVPVLKKFAKDYDVCMQAVEAFLPYIDNWAICDGLSPKVFKDHKPELLEKIKQWIPSQKPYICRFGMEMLMRWFLDEDFKPEYLKMPAAVRYEEYYVNMMTAWFFATALAKQWDATIPYLQDSVLEPWTHNKTIQKARESFRITPEQKEYLKTLKVECKKSIKRP